MNSHKGDEPIFETSDEGGEVRRFMRFGTVGGASPLSSDGTDEEVPFLMLRGPWLREMGMDVGTRLRMEVGVGIIRLTPVTDEADFSDDDLLVYDDQHTEPQHTEVRSRTPKRRTDS